MHGQKVHDGDREAFYCAALHALRFCDAQDEQKRRFGPEADALWGSFSGTTASLSGDSERIDLLLRDADAQWTRAFAPRVVFSLEGVADDEPFGPAWAGIEPLIARKLWTEISKQPAKPELISLIESIAKAWDIELSPVGAPAITPTSRFVVAGASAIATLIFAFAEGEDLAWAEQVLVVAERPAARHLAALASALLRSTGHTLLLRVDEQPHASFAKATLITTDDANANALSWAKTLAGAV